jgi:cytochrome P450 family 117 subfamily A
MLTNPLARSVRYRDGLPILPGAFPLLGHAPAVHYDALGTIRWGRNMLGPLFWVNLGLGTWVVGCAEPESFELLKNTVATNAPMRDMVYPLVGESLLGQDGPAHQRVRSILNTPFSPRGLTATGAGAIIAELMMEEMDLWVRRRSIAVLAAAQDVTLKVIFRLIGVKLGEVETWSRYYRDFVLSALPQAPAWIPGSPTRRAKQARVWLNEHLIAILDEERRRPENGSLISSLVHGRDEQGQGLTDRRLVDNLLLLTLAGHETTASVLAWMAITLAQRPDLWDSLVSEARGLSSFPTTPQEIRAFPFAEALFRETLRFYPSAVLTSRRLSEPVTLCHRRLPAGTAVGIMLGVLGRDPSLYANPDRLDPARWLGKREPPTPLELVQFGGGPHFCLGYHLAWLESVQFALALGSRLSAHGLRPRLASGSAPVHLALPLGHPTKTTRIELVKA